MHGVCVWCVVCMVCACGVHGVCVWGGGQALACRNGRGDRELARAESAFGPWHGERRSPESARLQCGDLEGQRSPGGHPERVCTERPRPGAGPAQGWMELLP